MLQTVIVAVIVVLAFGYACSKYLPAAWRQRLVFALTRRGARQSTVAQWLNTESSCGGGCDSCKACADPASPDSAPPQRAIKLHVRR